MTAAPYPPDFPRVGFTWGIKRSFIRYISYLPDGNHVVEDGAYLNDASLFTYPCSPASVSDAGELRSAEPCASADTEDSSGCCCLTRGFVFPATGGTLSVVAPSQWPSRQGRITLAELRCERQPTDKDLVLRCAASLAEEGVSVFGGNYPQGTTLDPVVIR